MNKLNRLLVVLLSLSVLLLPGCFRSAMPLISVFNSVAPIPEGRYTYVDTDKSTKSVIITNDGTATKMTTIDADGSAKIKRFLMQKIDKNYYVVMDDDNNYSLIIVNPNSVMSFNGLLHCDKLLGVARSAGKSISEYGVVNVTGSGESHACWFDDVYNIKASFAALQGSGTRLSNGTFLVNGLEIFRTYERQ